MSSEFSKEKQKAIAKVRRDGHHLKDLHAFRGDKDVVLEAVQHETAAYGNETVLSLTTPELQNDDDVVMAALRCYGYALSDANPRFAKSKEAVRVAFMADSTSLRDADMSLRDNVEYIKELTRISPDAFACASDRIRTEEKIVREFMEIDYRIAQYVLNKPLQKQLKAELKAKLAAEKKAKKASRK